MAQPPASDRLARQDGRGPVPDEALDALVTVLDEIRLGPLPSRSELVERTGLGRAIVAQRVGELIERGLVTEGDVGPSTGGRPPRQLTFRADGGHVLVADLGATSIDVAVTTLDGRILGHHDEPARIEAGPERCLDRVDALFESLLRTTQALPGPAVGDRDRRPGPGRVRGRAARSRRRSCPAGTATRSASGSPSGTAPRSGSTTTSTCWPSGEWRSGVAAGHDNVVVVKIGTGIGAGIISDGHLHRGAQGSAGDVGHIQVTDDPAVVCRCGNIGCLEALAGGEALGRAGEAAADDGRSPRLRAALDQRGTVTAEDVARAASFGDPLAMALLQAAGRRVGSMLASVVNFFNPSLIVIGGGVANSPDQFLASIRETVYSIRALARCPWRRATCSSSARRSAAWPASSGRRRWSWTSCSRGTAIGRWIEAGDPSGVARPAAWSGPATSSGWSFRRRSRLQLAHPDAPSTAPNPYESRDDTVARPRRR